MSQPGFWGDQQQANKIMSELKQLKATQEPWLFINKELGSIKELAAVVEEKDTSSIEELRKELSGLDSKVKELEFKTLMSGENDPNNAILSINAGAGGTEACDWVAMLFRMYKRWAEKHGYKTKVLDYLQGEEAGIKNSTIFVEGPYAFGYLKAETGVHRLVRISPFDANKRRHTSFASVDVIPEVTEEIKIEVKEKDLRIDVYRATGPGGQGVNTTDSAVRITHMPSGIVVQCQNERSQLQNKNTAMKVLKARLYEKEKRLRDEKMEKEFGKKMEIAWGSQIRSYVFQPYTMVKDHRTDVETGKGDAVMDGDIDMFIEAFLKKRKA